MDKIGGFDFFSQQKRDLSTHEKIGKSFLLYGAKNFFRSTVFRLRIPAIIGHSLRGDHMKSDTTAFFDRFFYKGPVKIYVIPGPGFLGRG